jgi:putative restriction endonuclease
MRLPIFADDGSPIQATCSVIKSAGGWEIFIESRSGTLGKGDARNAEYALGFATIFRRLAAVNAVLEDAFVESHKLLRDGLTEAERRLQIVPQEYPLVLTDRNVEVIQKQLRRAQRDIGANRTRGAGNTTRRVKLQLRIPDERAIQCGFVDFVTGARAVGFVPNSEIEELANDGESASAFNPSSVVDARERILRAITLRQGQPAFRRQLLQAYKQRCAISRCNAPEVLEAAHIVPYAGSETHHVQNGLLLRGDLHTLFDRGLIGVNPRVWKVVIHPSLQKTSYRELKNAVLHRPQRRHDWPHFDALSEHLRATGLPQET